METGERLGKIFKDWIKDGHRGRLYKIHGYYVITNGYVIVRLPKKWANDLVDKFNSYSSTVDIPGPGLTELEQGDVFSKAKDQTSWDYLEGNAESMDPEMFLPDMELVTDPSKNDFKGVELYQSKFLIDYGTDPDEFGRILVAKNNDHEDVWIYPIKEEFNPMSWGDNVLNINYFRQATPDDPVIAMGGGVTATKNKQDWKAIIMGLEISQTLQSLEHFYELMGVEE